MSLVVIISCHPELSCCCQVTELYCLSSQSDRANYDCDMISSCRRQIFTTTSVNLHSLYSLNERSRDLYILTIVDDSAEEKSGYGA